MKIQITLDNGTTQEIDGVRWVGLEGLFQVRLQSTDKDRLEVRAGLREKSVRFSNVYLSDDINIWPRAANVVEITRPRVESASKANVVYWVKGTLMTNSTTPEEIRQLVLGGEHVKAAVKDVIIAELFHTEKGYSIDSEVGRGAHSREGLTIDEAVSGFFKLINLLGD